MHSCCCVETELQRDRVEAGRPVGSFCCNSHENNGDFIRLVVVEVVRSVWILDTYFLINEKYVWWGGIGRLSFFVMKLEEWDYHQ